MGSRTVSKCVFVIGVMAPIALAGCSAATKQPTMIVVADKDVRSRWESQEVGLANSVTGRVGAVRRDEIVRQYWVKGTDGRWYSIGKNDWKAAKVGESLGIRPALPEREPIGPSLFPCVGPDRRWGC